MIGSLYIAWGGRKVQDRVSNICPTKSMSRINVYPWQGSKREDVEGVSSSRVQAVNNAAVSFRQFGRLSVSIEIS